MNKPGLIAFAEGFAVLSIELGTSKILSSYYGATYSVWTLVIVLTLFALTLGYYLGGLKADERSAPQVLFKRLLIGSILVAIIPIVAGKTFSMISSEHFFTSLILATLVIVTPSLLFVGSVTSLLIGMQTDENNNAGNAAGKVYALSAIGGTAAIFFAGVYLIPNLGVTYTLEIASALLIISAFLVEGIQKRRVWVSSSILLFIFLFLFAQQTTLHKKSKAFNVVYENEGLLGQLKVLDFKPPSQNFSVRRLLINGIPQTFILNAPEAYSYWRYPHFIAAFSTMKQRTASALLVGFGGGSVARELKSLGFKFDVVELDERILPVAKKYFYFNTDSVNYVIDDVRHYFKKTQKKYDLVVFDVLSGEVQPNYVFTLESLAEMKRSLQPDAICVINYQGILDDPEDKAFSTLYKTFCAAGFDTHYWATDPKIFEDIVFVISPSKINIDKIDPERLSQCCKLLPQMKDFLKKPVAEEGRSFAEIEPLTDDKPVLDHLNSKAMINWRKVMLRDITDPELKDGISIFK